MKRTIKHLRRNDPVSQIETNYKNAVADEDYSLAATYRDKGAGLTGWWCGRGATEDEPGGQYGVMMQVTPEHGRYVGRSYSARDLAVMQEEAKKGKFRNAFDTIGSLSDSDSNDTETMGHPVFELWIEHDSEMNDYKQKAVRIDHFPVGALGGVGEESSVDEEHSQNSSEDSSSGKGFATALGGFPLSGPIVVNGRDPIDVKGGDENDSDAFTVLDPGSSKQSGFQTWSVKNGVVNAPNGDDFTDQNSPFPFNVDGVSMEELLSYETQGFMADFADRTPGFTEVWDRLKNENEKGSGMGNESRSDSQSDPDVFEAFGGLKKDALKKSREPRDEYFFEQYVINETLGDDGGIIDLDDLDDVFDLDDEDGVDLELLSALEDDDDDFSIDAAAMAMLNGRRLDQFPKGLPAAMLADIQKAIESRGLGRAVFPDENGDGSVGLLTQGSDASSSDDYDPWSVEEVRIPVNLDLDGHHGFKVWSDAEDEEEDQAEDGIANISNISNDSNSALKESPLSRTLREASSTKAEVEQAVRDGMADAKQRLAEELRDAADAANKAGNGFPGQKGDTERIMVNLDLDVPLRDPSTRIGKQSEDDSDVDSDSARSKNFDETSLDSNASAMRFSPNSAANVFGVSDKGKEKSKGERFFERLVSGSVDEDDEDGEGKNASETDDDDSEASTSGSSSKAPEVPRGFISPKSFASIDSESDEVSEDEQRSTEDAASALIEALGGDSDALPLPMKARFTRIPPTVANRSSNDPFDRLYLGAFGPHGPEVLRLVRGRWGDEACMGDDCVTAVKLTGDANVPAGAASFRAKIGSSDKLDSSFSYPEELGVVTRYKGQGRVAKPGFAERNWVDGELLLLDGRGGQLTGGAELGFVWAVPGERRLLILFSSLELPATETPKSMYLD